MAIRKFKDLEFYFHEPRLEMTQAGRLLVRLIFYSSYVILVTAAVIFLLSDIPAIFWSGALLLLFLLDRARRFGQGERSIRKIKVKPGIKINLTAYLTPPPFSLFFYTF